MYNPPSICKIQFAATYFVLLSLSPTPALLLLASNMTLLPTSVTCSLVSSPTLIYMRDAQSILLTFSHSAIVLSHHHTFPLVFRCVFCIYVVYGIQ